MIYYNLVNDKLFRYVGTESIEYENEKDWHTSCINIGGEVDKSIGLGVSSKLLASRRVTNRREAIACRHDTKPSFRLVTVPTNLRLSRNETYKRANEEFKTPFFIRVGTYN